MCKIFTERRSHFTENRKRVPHSVLARRSAPKRTRSVTLVVCLVIVSIYGLPIPGAQASDDPSTARPPADEGYTRESMAELGRPVPTPTPEPKPIVSPRVVHSYVNGKARPVRSQIDSKDFVPRHQSTRYVRSEHKAPDVVIRGSARKKNPVVRFVFWWNGWVIKTFHTKVGTVMLGTVGAKT